jgi:hypothetical protein
LSGMKSTFCTRKTLNQDFRILINQDAHNNSLKVAAKVGKCAQGRVI